MSHVCNFETTHYERVKVFGYDDQHTACGEPYERGSINGAPVKAPVVVHADATCETCRALWAKVVSP